MILPSVKQKFKLPNGQVIDLFYIGSLAAALGRTTNTVRKWEIAGVIPDPFFKDSNGRRLYSQEQIDAIVRCAERARIKQGLSIANTSFSQWCYKELEVLRKKYKGEITNGNSEK